MNPEDEEEGDEGPGLDGAGLEETRDDGVSEEDDDTGLSEVRDDEESEASDEIRDDKVLGDSMDDNEEGGELRALGDREALGKALGETLGEADALGDREALGEIDALGEGLIEVDTLDSEGGEMDDGLIEDDEGKGCVPTQQARPRKKRGRLL